MHKRLSIFLKVLTGMLFILACQKQTSLLPNENLQAGLHDTIPHDTIPHDTIPHDTIPHDTTSYPVRDTVIGLKITPEMASNDSTIILNYESTNTFKDIHPLLWQHSIKGDSSLIVYVLGVYRNHPSPTANNTAKSTGYYTPYINGDHPFTIHMYGRSYWGSITVTNTQYTFNWTHDTIISINPKILTR